MLQQLGVPQKGDLFGTDIYNHAKFHTDHLYHHGDIRPRTKDTQNHFKLNI